MTEQRNPRRITGVILLVLSLACALAFAIVSPDYPGESESDPEGILSFSGVDLYAFGKTVALFFAVAAFCFLGAALGLASGFSKLPVPLRLGGFCAAFLNAELLLLHIFKHGGFLFAMLETL